MTYLVVSVLLYSLYMLRAYCTKLLLINLQSQFSIIVLQALFYLWLFSLVIPALACFQMLCLH